MLHKRGAAKPLRLLLIEDNATDQRLLHLTIQASKWPIQLKCVRHGKEGLELLHRLPTNQWPHVIVTDLKMPILDGFGFLDGYAKLFGRGKKCQPDIYVTSSTICRSEVMRAKRHRLVRDFIPKPINKEMLCRIVGVPAKARV